MHCLPAFHDLNTKIGSARKFIEKGNKVKITLRFRGREMSHQEIGRDLLKQFADACAESGSVDKQPLLDGRFMTMIIAPLKNAK